MPLGRLTTAGLVGRETEVSLSTRGSALKLWIAKADVEDRDFEVRGSLVTACGERGERTGAPAPYRHAREQGRRPCGSVPRSRGTLRPDLLSVRDPLRTASEVLISSRGWSGPARCRPGRCSDSQQWQPIAYGIRRNQPKAPIAWWFLGAGVLLFITGDTIYKFWHQIMGQNNIPFPSFIDAIYVTMYPVLAVGLLLLARARMSRW